MVRNPEIDYEPLGKRGSPQVVRDTPEARNAEVDYNTLGKRSDAEIDYNRLGK